MRRLCEYMLYILCEVLRVRFHVIAVQLKRYIKLISYLSLTRYFRFNVRFNVYRIAVHFSQLYQI